MQNECTISLPKKDWYKILSVLQKETIESMALVYFEVQNQLNRKIEAEAQAQRAWVAEAQQALAERNASAQQSSGNTVDTLKADIKQNKTAQVGTKPGGTPPKPPK